MSRVARRTPGRGRALGRSQSRLTPPRSRLALAAAALLLATAMPAGCRGRSSPPAARPVDRDGGAPVMTLAERAQGAELCKRYVERVCACATRDPGFRDQCELARGQPEALEIHLALLAGKQGQLNDNETRAVEGQARAVIRSCVRSDGALDPAACPRP